MILRLAPSTGQSLNSKSHKHACSSFRLHCARGWHQLQVSPTCPLVTFPHNSTARVSSFWLHCYQAVPLAYCASACLSIKQRWQTCMSCAIIVLSHLPTAVHLVCWHSVSCQHVCCSFWLHCDCACLVKGAGNVNSLLSMFRRRQALHMT